MSNLRPAAEIARELLVSAIDVDRFPDCPVQYTYGELSETLGPAITAAIEADRREVEAVALERAALNVVATCPEKPETSPACQKCNAVAEWLGDLAASARKGGAK
jgi:hypothetical protein